MVKPLHADGLPESCITGFVALKQNVVKLVLGLTSR